MKAMLAVMGVLVANAAMAEVPPAEVSPGLAQIGASIAAEPLAACQKVDIRVNNQKTVKIKALKIDYVSVEDGKTRTEDFADSEVASGATDTVASDQSLQHIEGHTMKSIKLHYKAWCGGKWSTTMTYTDTSFSDAKCVYNKTYRVDLPSGNPC